MIEQKTTHVTEAQANLINQFKDKPTMKSFIESLVIEVQDLENECFELQLSKDFATATGAQVDGFGSIVGEAREGRNDVDYKTAIRGRMILNFSKGTIEEIIALIRNVAGNVRIHITEYFPAGFTAQILDPIDPAYVNPNKIAGIMASGRPAAVYGILLFGVTGSFRYDAGPGYDVGKYGGALS